MIASGVKRYVQVEGHETHANSPHRADSFQEIQCLNLFIRKHLCFKIGLIYVFFFQISRVLLKHFARLHLKALHSKAFFFFLCVLLKCWLKGIALLT